MAFKAVRSGNVKACRFFLESNWITETDLVYAWLKLRDQTKVADLFEMMMETGALFEWPEWKRVAWINNSIFKYFADSALGITELSPHLCCLLTIQGYFNESSLHNLMYAIYFGHMKLAELILHSGYFSSDDQAIILELMESKRYDQFPEDTFDPTFTTWEISRVTHSDVLPWTSFGVGYLYFLGQYSYTLTEDEFSILTMNITNVMEITEMLVESRYPVHMHEGSLIGILYNIENYVFAIKREPMPVLLDYISKVSRKVSLCTDLWDCRLWSDLLDQLHDYVYTVGQSGVFRYGDRKYYVSCSGS